ncbi:MAG: glycosyltransferase family 2 protein [Terracidiphilus sp.]
MSIVTPMYNEEKHLAVCIESLLAQTYRNWECLIADNCSTDGSPRIARDYADKDPRIRVQRNDRCLRAVANFNAALRKISPSSKYCKVVFADDFIFPECLERMVSLAEANPSVGIVGAYGLQGDSVMWTGLPYPSEVVPGRELCRRYFLDGLYVFGTATSLLFRAELVRNRDPFFDESNLHSDCDTCLELLKNSDFGFVNQVLTFTRVRERSLLAFSTELNTFLAGRLHDLITHGSDYLTPAEYERCLKLKLKEYYRYLAWGLIHRRGKEFWKYHRAKMEEVGVGFSRARVVREALLRIVNAVLNTRVLLKIAGERQAP